MIYFNVVFQSFHFITDVNSITYIMKFVDSNEPLLDGFIVFLLILLFKSFRFMTDVNLFSLHIILAV